MNRRIFISSMSAFLSKPLLPALSLDMSSRAFASKRKPAGGHAEHTIRIEPCSLEISPGVTVQTFGYNGQVPGPVLRLRQNAPVSIDVINKTSHADIVHWHGLTTDVLNDGASEEGSPMIPAGATQRYHLTPNPSGTRWYHTHTTAGSDLSLGQYGGQFGFLIVEGKDNPGHYDQEILLAVHHWEPSFVPMPETMQAQSASNPRDSGSDVGYKYATINAHRLGAGEPIRVKEGQKLLLRLLNASATDNVLLALPGHTFEVIAMDGNPVPNPRKVEVVCLAAAERIDAIVEMNSPGVWVLGSTKAEARAMGLGIVVEYAGRSGEPVWRDPSDATWDYTQFASQAATAEPDETIRLIFNNIGPKGDPKFDWWAINRKSWPNTDPINVKQGKRYRLNFLNASGDQHPMHLHRHSFEVTRIGKKNLSGLTKDVINVLPLQTVNVDFVANNPGNSLLHCHMQLHMDYGFMQLVKYVG